MISERPPIDAEAGPSWEDFHALEERLDRRSTSFNTWTIFIWMFAAVALVFSIIGMTMGTRDVRSVSASATPAAAPVALAAASGLGPVGLSEFAVRPAATTVAAGSATFQITNNGTMQHELLVFRSDLAPAAYPLKDGNIDEESPLITKVSDGDNLDPGTSQTRTVDLTKPGTYVFVCNLPGHFKAGMFTVVTVK